MSLNETDTLPSVPSDFRNRTRGSSCTTGMGGGGGEGVARGVEERDGGEFLPGLLFFGLLDQNRRPLLFSSFGGGGAWRGGGVICCGRGVGSWRWTWGWRCLSRRTFRVRVNSSLLCSILELKSSATRRSEHSRDNADSQLELLIDCAVRGKYRFRRRYEVNAVVQRHRELSGLFRKRQLEAPQADN